LLVGGVLAVAGLVGGGLLYVRTESYWKVGQPAAQPIPFRHDIHAGTLGLDCRFCHSSVEQSATAGMPSANTCLTCHSQIWTGANVLEPLRSSVTLDQPVRWSSVHRLPEHAYFHHAVHVAANISCATCHGAVETMSRTVKTETLSMGWCLSCHRRGGENANAQAETVPRMTVAESHPLSGAPLEATTRLTDCSACHR
jgi:hypothetical protein